MVVLPIFTDGGKIDEDDPAFLKVCCWSINENNRGFDLLNLEGETLLSYTNNRELKAENVITEIDALDFANIVDEFVYYVDLDSVREEAVINPRAMLFAAKSASVLNHHYEKSMATV